jgi:hypothetical protein
LSRADEATAAESLTTTSGTAVGSAAVPAQWKGDNPVIPDPNDAFRQPDQVSPFTAADSTSVTRSAEPSTRRISAGRQVTNEVKARVLATTDRAATFDSCDIEALERGNHRLPDPGRREALHAVLGSDAEGVSAADPSMPIRVAVRAGTAVTVVCSSNSSGEPAESGEPATVVIDPGISILLIGQPNHSA